MSKCGADTPVREMSAPKASHKKLNKVRALLTRPCVLLMAALREIFEESAYERFLGRRSLTSSPRAYRDFLRETEQAKARRPKCC